MIRTALLIAAALLLGACDKPISCEEIITDDAEFPTVEFSNLPASVEPNSTIDILVLASDNVEIKQIDLYIDGEWRLLSWSDDLKYTYRLGNVPNTPYVLNAVVRDTNWNSASVTATVRTSQPN
jgi:hypothetical protein